MKRLCLVFALMLLCTIQAAYAEAYEFSLWNSYFDNQMIDEIVEITEEDKIRYLRYHETVVPYAGEYANLTLEQRLWMEQVADPLFITLPQDGDITQEDAMVIAYGWLEQHGYITGEEFLSFAVATSMRGLHGDSLRFWNFRFLLIDSVWEAESDPPFDLEPFKSHTYTALINVDVQTGHIAYTDGYWNEATALKFVTPVPQE